MKKKFMMAAVLLGALTLGSCVDDNESASVTAIRDAKAAQLSALATLYNAQAAAEAVRADAEAAFNKAKANYQQAKADATAAETTFLTEKYKLELEKIAAVYDAKIAEAKKEAALADKQAWENVSKHVANVYEDYTNALGEIHSLSKELIEKNYDLSMVDVNEEANQAYFDKTIANYNQQIADKTAQIERLKSLNTDKAALETQLNNLAKQAYDLTYNQKPAAEEAEDKAKEAYDDAYYTINRTQPNDQHEILEWEASKLAYVKAIDTLMIAQIEYNNNNNPDIELVEINNETIEAVEGCTTPNTITTYALSEGSDYLDATQKIARWFAGRIENQTETVIGHPSNASATPAVNATGWYLTLENAQATKKRADDKLAAEKAKPTPDADLIKEYTEESQDAQVQILAAEEGLADAQKVLEDIKAQQKSYTDNLAIAAVGTAQQKEYIAAVEVATKAKQAWMTATHEVHKIEAAINVIGIKSFEDDGSVTSNNNNVTPPVIGYDVDGEYGIIKSLYEDAKTVQDQILALEESIADLKQFIANFGIITHYVERPGRYYDPSLNGGQGGWVLGTIQVPVYGSKVTAEETKKLIEMEIANIKAEIAAYEKMAALYKAELESLVGSTDSEPAA